MNKQWALFYGCLFGTRAGVLIYVYNERLTPDTSEYAAGHAVLNSTGAAAVGSIFGLAGLKAYGLLGACILGVLVGGISNRWWLPAVVFILPPGWYTMQASADAMGTVFACLWLLRQRQGAKRYESTAEVVLTILAHAAAGVALVVVLLADRIGTPRMAAFLGTGAVCCGLETHLQVRYWLPGLAMAAITYGQGREVKACSSLQPIPNSQT